MEVIAIKASLQSQLSCKNQVNLRTYRRFAPISQLEAMEYGKD